MKKCTKCGIEKPLEEFVKHKSYKDGRYSQCKICTRKQVSEWSKSNNEIKKELRTRYRIRNREKIREQDRESYRKNPDKFREKAKINQGKYFRTEKGRIKYLNHRKIQYEKFPEKERARAKLYQAVKLGRIIKPNICSRCKKSHSIIQAHHEDYKRPLDVIWVCISCHFVLHRTIHADRLSEKTSKEEAIVEPHMKV